MGNWVLWMAAVFGGTLLAVDAAPAGRVSLSGHVPAVTHRLTATGNFAATNRVSLAIGLPLHNEAALDQLIRQLYDPHSTNFHQFLSTTDFTARFGPTEAEYQAVITFAQTNGLTIVGTRGNRSVLDVEGSAADVNRALGITLHTWRHPVEHRDFFAPDTEPSVPANLSVSAIEGLSDYQLPHPLSHAAKPLQAQPLSGSGPSGYLAGNDFRNAYAAGTPLTGAGQKVGLLEFSSYYMIDITNYESTIGMTNRVPLSNVTVGSGTASSSQNEEVALDIEMAIAMAPQLTQVIVYEEKSVNPSSILSRMASDNLAKQLSSSWSWSGGPSSGVDTQLKQMITQGQSFFQATGDSDAYTGSQPLDNTAQSVSPVDSTNLTAVGGTTLSMNGSGASRSSETVWNYAPYGGTYANEGSGGGISAYYTLPAWQSGVSMASNQGSATWRNIPDVAMAGDSIYVAYGNGNNGGAAGTSCAAPLWAGLTALINQQAAAHSSASTVGFLNPALYNIGTNANYSACFYDITTGNDTGTNTAGLFNAVTGYDLASGWGTPNGTNLINALAPAPGILVQPVSQTVIGGTNVSLTAAVLGQPPLAFQWRLAGTNLPGATTLPLALSSVTTNNAGSYTLVITNVAGAITSSVAALTVVYPPAITAQPAGLTVLNGSNATFSATVTGTTPLAYQWRKNSTALSNGTGIAGATTNVLTLTGVTTNSAGSYSLFVTNLYGSVTSSVASLIVGVIPTLTGSVTNRTLQCGSNIVTAAVTAAGTAPFAYQWSLDGSPVTAATNTSFSITNLLSPSHTLAVIVTNLYGTATNSATLTVSDTLPPAITLLGANPFSVELGGTFTDPGATASDTCVGSVGVTITGTVTTNLLGTNTLTYTAGDGNGNTNSLTRTVIVRDTTPPTITWSFTNLALGTVTNCGAPMPNVTGTNYIIATDLSGPPVITQTPTNGTFLPLGTNTVILTATDTSGNQSYSTNTVTVSDATPPAIIGQPQSVTNLMGTTAGFSLTATACTPLTWQWYFGTNLLAGATNTTLTVSNVTSALAGNYFATATSAGGSTTSGVATLTVVCPPAITGQPAGLTVLTGSNASFTATATGTAPLTYQWRQNGTNLNDGTGISGSATGTLSLTGVTTNSAGNYNLIVANLYGTATSSIASLIVGVPPTLTGSVTNQTLQCGSNNVTFAVVAAGSAPFGYEWDLDGAAVAGATNASIALTNLLAPGHTLAIIVTNLYGSVTNTAVLTVVDTLPPVITLLGTNPASMELGGTYLEPGATAYDTCVGGVSVTLSGYVNGAVLGTNTLVYTADDGNGNTNTVTRTVIVRDTTPPAITWSFTNLVLGATNDCGVLMPDLTGTNGILATDLSGPPVITQTPTNGAFLPMGANTVILTATDSSGNASFSTNTITVLDESPPVIVTQPQSQTNNIGTTVTFSAAATACTPLTWQWYAGTNVLTGATNGTLTLGNVSPAQAGNYFVVAASAGGTATSSVVTLAVNLLVTTVTPLSSANPDGYLDNLTFTAAIAPTNATGSVQFFTNGVAFDTEPVAAGQAVSTNTTWLPRGTNAITMIYSGDANDLPATNELDQIVTNHPPVGLPVTYTYGAGTLLSIALTNLAANWSDVDSDAVSLAAVSVSTNGITLTNSGGFLIYGNPANGNDQFVCTLTDGWGGTNYETVNLTVAFPLIANAVVNPDTTLGLTLTGSAGATYVLLSTPGLQPADWQPVATNTLDSSGTWNFNAGSTTNAGQMFYQLQLVP